MFVTHRFKLNQYTIDTIRDMEPKFGYDGFGEIVFYRTYSREKKDGSQENWADVVIRVTEGTFSIRKDWYLRNHIDWDEKYWQEYAYGFAIAMFKMEWLPPGRGLWAMGTDFVYERGSMALYNCGSKKLGKSFHEDIAWLMDALMCGVGVGFRPERDDDLKLFEPQGTYEFIIQDTREGWTDSVKRHIYAYMTGSAKPDHKYHLIRKAGSKIKGFGGICSGYKALELYHQDIDLFCNYYMHGIPNRNGELEKYDSVLLKTDLANGAGYCTVSGNVRRSAELAAGKVTDKTFLNLKDYEIYPHRERIGWLSNNSVLLEKDSDFDYLGEIARRVLKNGEPGYINLQNLPYGRIGKKMNGLRKDKADSYNPCLTYDTKICLADGRGFVSIGELIGEDVLVYCIDEYDNPVVRMMRNVRKTGGNKKILKIIFDSGDSIRVTENHRVMLRDRSFAQADELKVGDSVGIFERRISGSIKYGNKTYFESSLVERIYKESAIPYCIDGINYIKRKCEGCKKDFLIREELREKAYCSQLCCALIQEFSRKIEQQRRNKATKYIEKLNNHKVISVIEDGFEDVYNGTVDDYHNFIVGGWKDKGISRGVITPQCGEIPLESSGELCNIAETLPTVCENVDIWYKACDYATTYCQTVSLLPTHQPETNKVIARNRRIGVSIIDFTGWKLEHGVNKVTKWMRQGYKNIVKRAANLAAEAGVPAPIRHTTIKPGGTTPKLAGKTPGIGHPTSIYTIRRMRAANDAPIHSVLVGANIPYEKDCYSANTDVFSYPIIQGPAKPAEEVPLWEQAMNLILVQREFADNSVSNTLYFKPMWRLIHERDEYGLETRTFIDGLVDGAQDLFNIDHFIKQRSNEVRFGNYKLVVKRDNNKGKIVKVQIFEYDPRHEENDVEPVLSAIAPHTKSVSLLPHSPKGAYKQMPEEGITKEEYLRLKADIKKIDWSKFKGSDGEDEKYCQGPTCEVKLN